MRTQSSFRTVGLAAAFALLFASSAAAGEPKMSVAQADPFGPCNTILNPAELEELVNQCIEVSPATRPPCNGENSCEMITDEIQRGCKMLGSDAPAFCSGYIE